MALTQAFFGCPGPATSVSATRVFPARLSRWRGTSGVAEIAKNKIHVATASSGTARVGSCRRHNTWGLGRYYGGGDRNYNDLIVQLDFTSAAGHGWIA